MAQSDPNISREDQTGPAALPADGELTEQIDERWLAVIDAALKVQAPLAHSYVHKLRQKHPEATDRQLLEHVFRNRELGCACLGADIARSVHSPPTTSLCGFGSLRA